MDSVTLWWTREDRQGSLDMGHYATKEEAEAAIPSARAMLLGECGTSRDIDEVKQGRWEIEEITSGEKIS